MNGQRGKEEGEKEKCPGRRVGGVGGVEGSMERQEGRWNGREGKGLKLGRVDVPV